ncbi:MAG: helix-turn-helix transcriptional regulator [Halorientalis sp.]
MSRVPRWLLVGAAVVAACWLCIGPAAAQSAGTGNTSLSPDSTLIRIDAAADGAAAWEIQYQFYLTESGETEAFASYRQDIEANRSRYVAAFAADIRPSVRRAENETGREMSLSNVTVTVRRQRLAQPTGIVTYRFTWNGFVGGNASTLLIGDAISGFYLGPDTRLTVTWPDGYRLVRVTPAPTDRRRDRVAWEGELGFGATAPRIVVTTKPEPEPAQSGGIPLLAAGVAVLILAALGTAGVLYVRARTGDDAGDGAPATGSASVTDDSAADDRRADLLSDDERALAAVRDHGGRIKQQELADACDWGDSKTSRVVNRLQDDDEIDVFRLGRENVITLPEETHD